ncbi:MAG: endolytic transglycosylase MltG [Flavobacteriaceae bacterium]|nr:endolytic transglycosylase MltG [Flavobacteriaceae bacterium]
MKYVQYSLLLLLVTGLSSCSYFYADKQNVVKEGHLYIYPNATYQQVLDSLSLFVKDIKQFDVVARAEEMDKFVKPGRYLISEAETNKELALKLKNGKEDEVKLMVKNSPTIFHLARDVSKNIIADSLDIVEAILSHEQFVQEGLDLETSKIYFIPNTYNFLWLTSGKTFVDRMIKEHDIFWNDERKQKLAASGMTELEVYTLASIVQMEASKADEQPKVAQAYLNRLKQGRRLEADPTSVYAYRLEHGFDKKIQRVYHKHLKTASAYNTYLNTGLPPAPITLPNGTAIDAVLSPEPHDMIFFCADPDRPGYHSFTNSYTEHLANAAKYRKWLKENNIK